MFDRVKFGASDYAASKAFFLEALAPLGAGGGRQGQRCAWSPPALPRELLRRLRHRPRTHNVEVV